MKHLRPRADPDQHLRTEHLDEDLRGRSIRGGAVTVGAQGLKLGVRLGSTVILARLLSPTDFGLIAMVTAVTGFLAMFKDLGLSMATIQRPEISHAQVSNLFWINLAVSTALTLLVIALAPVLAWFYGEPALVGITSAIAGAFLFGGLAVQHLAILKRQMRFTRLAVIEILSMIIAAVAAVVSALNGWGYWALVVLVVTEPVVTGLGSWIASDWRPRRPSRREGTRSLATFGGHITGFNVVNYFARNLDNILIGRVWGGNQLGLYSKAYELLLFPIRQINAPLASVAIPALSRLVTTPQRYRRAYVGTLEKMVMITMPGVVFMIFTADWLIEVVLGSQWSGASAIFAWLGVAALTQPIGNSTGWLFISQGRARDMFHWGILGGTIAMISIIAGLPWGAVGVAMSYALIGVFVRTPLLIWFVGRAGPIRPVDFWRAMRTSLWSAAGVAVALAVLRGSRFNPAPIVGLLAGVALAAVVATTISWAHPDGRRAAKDLWRMSSVLVVRGK